MTHYQNGVLPNAEKKAQTAKSNLFLQDGSYYWKSKDKQGNYFDYAISNFIIYPKYLLKHNRHPKRIIKIINEDGQESVIAMPVKSMVNLNEFSAIVEGKGNFIPDFNKKQFVAIKKYLYAKEQQAEEIELLGYQPYNHFFAFANGIYDGKDFHFVDEYGIVSINNTAYYIPALSKINEDAGEEYRHEQKFIYRPSKTGFKVWNNLVSTVYQDNGKVGIAFTISAIFRDIIYKQVDFFPLLFLFGPPKTGKSTLRAAMLHLFGDPQSEISLGSASSSKGFARKLGQFRNGLISFEEYKNSIKRQLIEMLKSTYDGIGYERAQMTNDNKTHSSYVHSAVIVAGQEMPTKENALFSRVILLEFQRKSFDNAADFERLKDVQDKGLGKVILEILAHRNLMQSQFKDTYQAIYNTIKYDIGISGVDDRNIKNVAAILAPIKILSKVLPFSFSYEDLFTICIAKMQEQNEIMERTNEANQFFQIFDLIKNEPKTQIDHLYLINDGILYIRYNEIYSKYREYGIRAGYDILDKESMLKYLKQHPSFYLPKSDKKNRDSHLKRFKIFEDGKGGSTTTPKRCCGFNINEIELLEI